MRELRKLSRQLKKAIQTMRSKLTMQRKKIWPHFSMASRKTS